MVTNFPTSAANVTEGLKNMVGDYSFLVREVADRLRTHRWFPRLNRIVGISFSTVIATIAVVVIGAGGVALGIVLVMLTVIAAALIIAAIGIAIVTLVFLSIFL
ncbi:hypothetical protein C0J52_07218 [Blattella germanica]|nr:hypothetical protein C0J52_07218 [Blattella germanica]